MKNIESLKLSNLPEPLYDKYWYNLSSCVRDVWTNNMMDKLVLLSLLTFMVYNEESQ